MKRTRLILSLILTAFVVWGFGFAQFLVRIESIVPEQIGEKTDAIVVLTGGNYRINTALDLFADGLAPRLLITGVHKSVKDYEILAGWKGKKPLPDCCLTLGHDATTTIGNADETFKWVQENNVTSIRVVTSAYHMPRALLEFHHQMPDVDIIVHPVEEKDYAHTDWRFWYISISEYNKTLLRRIFLMMSQRAKEI